MLGLIVVLVIALAAPLAAAAQPAGKIPSIGVLVTGGSPTEHPCVTALRRGLAEFGYAEGRTHVLEFRWAEGQPEKTFPRFGAELVRLGVDVIVSTTSVGLVEAKQAMATIPVVMAASTYPVERGLIASLSRPGGNITGLATFTGPIYAKRVQLVAETLPGLSRVAVLRFPGDQNDLIVRDLKTTAQQFGLTLQVIEVQRREDIPKAFHAAVQRRAQAIMTTQGPFFVPHLREIADLAIKHKLPSFSGEPGAAEAGILMSLGPSVTVSCQRAAYFVDRILKGAKPADLPVEQATKFDLVINGKTANALGLTIPSSVLLRADQVIE